MRGKYFLAMAAAMVFIAALIFTKRLGKKEIVTEVTAPAAASHHSSDTQTNEQRTPATVSINGQPKAILPKPADPKFQKWLSDEAKDVDRPHVNSELKEQQIKKIAGRLTKAQSEQLLQTVNNPTAPPSEKILSTYLMVEGGLNTREELRAFISSPMKEQGPHEPHSEGEVNGVREKSLRIMAIDGLFTQAKNDPQAKAALASAVADSEDPYIKAYAQEKLNQLSR
jgi:hypothetical protein